MTMPPRLRKLMLTTHIVCSVGWLGAAVTFLVLAVAAVTSQDVQTVRAVYLSMALTGWYVIVPLCLASLLSGLVVSLGTRWGLFRHYWVLIKLVITFVSALILFGFTPSLDYLRILAADTTLAINELRGVGQSPILHSGGGLLALLVTTTLSVYKPRGLTYYGRKQSSKLGH